MSCCQYVSLDHLAALIGQLRSGSLSDAERADYERFFLKCVPDTDALAFVTHPECHPANPNPGTTPNPGELALFASNWLRTHSSAPN